MHVALNKEILIKKTTDKKKDCIYVYMKTFFQFSLAGRRRLFPFRKRSLPLLTVDAIIGNQASIRADVVVHSGLCYNKAIFNFFKPFKVRMK